MFYKAKCPGVVARPVQEMMGFVSKSCCPNVLQHSCFLFSFLSGAPPVDLRIHPCLQDLEPLTKTDVVLFLVIEEKKGLI